MVHPDPSTLDSKMISEDLRKSQSSVVSEIAFRPKTEVFIQADQIARQLYADWCALDAARTDAVSPLARTAPRIGSMAERATRIGHLAANRLAQLTKAAADGNAALGEATETPTETDVPSIMRYRRVLQMLRRALDERDKRAAEEARSAPKRLSCALRRARAEVDKPIERPTPMPVEEAPLEELQPFFEFLKSNTPFDEPQKEFVRGVAYDDGRIDLCKQVVGPGKIGHLMRSITNNNFVEHFLLGNNIVGGPGSEAIAAFIAARVGHVKTWYLAGNCIDTDGIKLIGEALADDRHADALWLKRNPLGPLGGAHLGQLLSVNRTLRTLDLTNAGLLDDGTTRLFDRLHENETLRILYLDANGIGPAAVPAMVGYVSRLGGRKGLTSLWLGINRLGDDGAVPLVEALGKYEHLKRLCLGSNKMGPKSALAIATAFADAPNLVDLELGMYKSTVDLNEFPNAFGDEGAGYLAELIERNQRLRILDFSCNAIGEAGYERLAQAVERNESLLYVVAHDYHNQAPADALARMRKKNSSNLAAFHQHKELVSDEKALFRLLRHGKRIGRIDSIYRNNM